MQQGMIDQQRPPMPKRLSGVSHSSRPRSTWATQTVQSTTRLTPSHSPFDAHPPSRGPTVDMYTKQARLASFRDSLRKDIRTKAQATQAVAVDEGHRIAMLDSKRHEQALVQQRQWEKGVMENAVDQRMRNGEMLDVHKAMLRKMQAKANEQG